MTSPGHRSLLRALRTVRFRLTLALLLAAVVAASGVTYGGWTVAGSGNGYAKAVTAQSLSLVDASASTSAQLYPGATGDLVVRVTNPNSFAVTITSVANSGGSIVSDKGAACNAATGVTYANSTGLSQAVAAGATITFSLANKVSMSNSSDNACQGAVFTIPISVSATS